MNYQLQQYNNNDQKTASLSKTNPYLQEDVCQLCEGEPFDLMLRKALYESYFSNQELSNGQGIDNLINQVITQETVKFRQDLVCAEDEEYLKREYQVQEFSGKIQTLSQYYKFHRNVPRIFQPSINKMLGKYYDRVRNFDYKKIKRILKEQDISLTTQRSDDSFYDGSSIQIKSRYSSVLHDLNNNSQNDSLILKDMCKKIGKAYQKMPFKNDFKGVYYSGQKKFQQYLVNLKEKQNKNSINNQQTLKNPLKNLKEFKQVKTHYQLYQKSYNQLMKINMGIPQVQNRKSNTNMKSRQQVKLNPSVNLRQTLATFKKPKMKNGKSIQKTTANETISREERSKKLDKIQKNLSNQIQKNIGIFKPLSADLIALKSNTMLKTLTQIYNPSTNNQLHEKYKSDKSKRVPSQSKTNLHKKYESKLDQNHIDPQIKSRKTSAKNSKHNSREINNIVDNILLLNNGQTDRRNNNQKLVQRSSSKKSLHKNSSVNKKSLSKHKESKVISTVPSINNLLKGRGHSTQKITNLQIWDQNLVNGGSQTQRRVERQSSKKMLPEKSKQKIRETLIQRNHSRNPKQKIQQNKHPKQKSKSKKDLHELKRQPSKQRLSRNNSKSSLKQKSREKRTTIQTRKSCQRVKKGEQVQNIDKLLQKKLLLFQMK